MPFFLNIKDQESNAFAISIEERQRDGRKSRRAGGLNMAFLVNVDSIPEDMKNPVNWVLYRLEVRDGKETKVPYQTNGSKAEPNNPETWGSLENVIKTFKKYPGKYDGIGFVFSLDIGIMGIDLDHVRNPETGEWDQEALNEIKILNSYTEISPSGEGAHVLVKGKIPLEPDKKGKIGTGRNNRDIGREMYHSGRYFTVTGNHLEGTPYTINEAQRVVNTLYYKWFGHRDEKKNKENKQRLETKIKLFDPEIIDIASRAKNAEKFNRLYSGDTSGYDSQSEADLALCSLIAYYTQDKEQIDHIFKTSGLYRHDKWEREDYRDRTIDKALQGITEIYSPDKRTKGKMKSDKKEPEKINVPFDVVGDRVRKNHYIFSMRDNGQIYLYKDGVYRSEGTEAILNTEIRNLHNEIYEEYWNIINAEFPLTHIPKATTKYVNEVLAYIRAYTHIPREDIEDDKGNYINLKNGLFNLDTWKLEPHDPNFKSIRQVPVNYNENAQCPQTNKFLKDVVAEPDIDLLCEIAGYCLTTDCSQQKAFMLYGVGSNGKSVFLTLLESLVGRENTSAESLQKLEFDKYRTAKLYGKLVNICGDIPDSKMHKLDVFKKLVSGLELIDGENKYQDPFVFRNTTKLVFSANLLPEGKKDKAYYRRWVLIQFPNNFEGGNEDKKLIEKLQDREELSGFLNLALQGLKRLRENGHFSNSKSIEDTQKEYEFNSNPIEAFMDECTTASQDDIDGMVLYSTCKLWGEVNNKRIPPYNQWAKELKKLGYENHRENDPGTNNNKKTTYWYNIKLIPEAQDRLNWKIDRQACPIYTVEEDDEKINLGQAGQALPLPQSCQKNKPYCRTCVFYKVGKGKNEKESVLSKFPLTNNPEARPYIRFFDTGQERTGSEDKHGNVPVLEQITLISEKSGEDNSMQKLKHLQSFRTDLKTLVASQYHGVVESVPDLLANFLIRNPGYKQVLEYQEMLEEAERINKWGWK